MKIRKALCALMLLAILFSQISANAVTVVVNGESYEIDDEADLSSAEEVEVTALDGTWLFDQLENQTDKDQILHDMIVAMYVVNALQQFSGMDIGAITLDSFVFAVEYSSGTDYELQSINEDMWILNLSEESLFEIQTESNSIVHLAFVLKNIENASGEHLCLDFEL